MPGTPKGQCFKKMEWGVIYLPRMNSLQFIFWLSLKQKLHALCVYGEDAKISTEIVYIIFNNNMNYKKIEILSICTIWDRLSLKTISRNCPFKKDRQPNLNENLYIENSTLDSNEVPDLSVRVP